jgi:hypothetical protein
MKLFLSIKYWQNMFLTEKAYPETSYIKNSKIKYSKFKALEETHPEIKVFLDLNRYSEIITSKLTGNYDLAKKLKKDVKIKNLTPKKIFLMTCPVFVLKFFIRIQPILIKYGLRNTFYK